MYLLLMSVWPCLLLLLLQASDEIGSLLVMTLKHKLRSFAFSPLAPKGCTAQLALGLANNSVEVGLELHWCGVLASCQGAGLRTS
jgi:hypothetical protein